MYGKSSTIKCLGGHELRKQLPKNYMKENYSIVETFDKNDWIGDEKKIKLAQNLAHVENGASSLEVITLGGVGTALSTFVVDKPTTNFSFVGKNKQILIKFFVPDETLIYQITVYFSNSTKWIDYTHYALLRDRAVSGRFRRGWNYMAIVPNEMNYSGNFDWSKPIKNIRLSITPTTDKPSSVTFDSIQIGGKGIPKILITFDDGWKTVYDHAYPIMRERGIRGTTYAIPWYHESQKNIKSPLFPYFCKESELMELHLDGWTIGNHTWNHDYYKTRGWNPITYLTQVQKATDWLVEKGFGDDANYMCFPNGEQDYELIENLKKIGIKTARPGPRRGLNPHNIDSVYETSSRNFDMNVSLEKAKSWVDYALESGGTSFFMFHQIPMDDKKSGEWENPYISWSVDKFEALMDYIVERGAVDNCANNREWFVGLSDPRFTAKEIKRKTRS